MGNTVSKLGALLTLTIIVFLTVAVLPVRAELPPLIPRAKLFADYARSNVSISPNGKMVSYIGPDPQGGGQLWIKTIGENDDKTVTHVGKSEIINLGWQFDNQHLLYRQDSSGDENWHIYQIDITSGVTRDLTPFLGCRAMPVDYLPEFPSTLLVTINTRDPKAEDLYSIDTTTGAVNLVMQNGGGFLQWLPDKSLHILGLHKLIGLRHEIRVRNANANDKFRPLITWGADDSDGNAVGFAPDDQSVYVRSSVGGNTDRLLKVDINTGERTVLAEDPQYDLGSVFRPYSREVEAVSFDKERRQWKAISPKVASDLQKLQGLEKGDFQIHGSDLTNKRWVVEYDQDDQPEKYYIYDRPTKKLTFLFDSHPALTGNTFAQMKPITVTARDGMKLHGYLTLPPGLPPESLPMVLEVHGGPWSRNRWGFNTTVQWLANRGYAVLQINFRGSTGYGKSYVRAGDREWGAKMLTDLIDAKDWAVKEGYANAAKICIDGSSYGGYAALTAAAFTPKEFTCAIDSAGPSNLNTLLKSIPPIWESERQIFSKRIGDPVVEPEFLASRSPLFKADQIQIPMLISQGANDIRVKQSEADQIVAAIRKNGKPVEYLLFPDEGHGLRPVDYAKFRARSEAFLAKYLGGRLEPMHAAESSDQFLH